MKQIPTLNTARLILRPFARSDAADVQRLAGDRAIADTTASIPHPYEDGIAEKWIATHQEAFEKDRFINFAVVNRQTSSLVGAICIMNISLQHGRGELGYWIGKPYWNNGFCTEAAEAIMSYGFLTMKLNRIHGCFLKRNPGSRRVMEKIRMIEEGCLRKHDKKWDQYEDLVIFGILKSEWERTRT